MGKRNRKHRNRKDREQIERHLAEHGGEDPLGHVFANLKKGKPMGQNGEVTSIMPDGTRKPFVPKPSTDSGSFNGRPALTVKRGRPPAIKDEHGNSLCHTCGAVLEDGRRTQCPDCRGEGSVPAKEAPQENSGSEPDPPDRQPEASLPETDRVIGTAKHDAEAGETLEVDTGVPAETLVEVKWVDSVLTRDGISPNLAKKSDVSQMRTVGYMIADYPDRVVIAMEHTTDDMGEEEYRCTQVIPRGCVKEVLRYGKV